MQFDDLSRCSLSDQPLPPGGVLRALRDSAETAGVDPVAELYNEALRYANEGHLRLSKERLEVLLALSPDDGEARLLLGKVFVAGQRWKDALTALDEATANGQSVPGKLRTAIEDHLRRQTRADEEQRAATLAREQGEIKALRQEARRLRSENAQLVGSNHELDRESKKWAWVAMASAGFTVLFVRGSLLFGGGAAPDASTTPGIIDDISPPVAALSTEAPISTVQGSPVVEALPPEAPAIEAPTPDELEAPLPQTDEAAHDLARQLAEARTTQGIDAVQVSEGVATLSGSVATHFDRKEAIAIALASPNVNSVNAEDLVVTAQSQGTTHTVVSGDMLGGIAYRYYGDSSLSQQIIDANESLLHGGTNLAIDMVLVIPPLN